MSGIIVFGSRYGTVRWYAEELARRVGFELKDHAAVRDMAGYDPIAYIGALYAGGVLGMKKTFARLSSCQGRRIAIATVGLADPTDPENVSNIEQNMERQLRPDVFAGARLFHLRGGIDYSKPSLKHRTMMGLLCKKAEGLPRARRTLRYERCLRPMAGR